MAKERWIHVLFSILWKQTPWNNYRNGRFNWASIQKKKVQGNQSFQVEIQRFLTVVYNRRSPMTGTETNWTIKNWILVRIRQNKNWISVTFSFRKNPFRFVQSPLIGRRQKKLQYSVTVSRWSLENNQAENYFTKRLVSLSSWKSIVALLTIEVKIREVINRFEVAPLMVFAT